MNIFKSIKKLFRNTLALNDPKAWDSSLWNLYGTQTPSGESVNEYNAMTYSAVWNAVYQISSTCGSLPLHLRQHKGRKTRHATENSMYRVMHTQFNPFMTAKIGRETLMSHVLTWGNGYAEKVTNGQGDLVELWPITPNRVNVKLENNQLIYKIKVDNDEIELKRDKILHIAGFGFDGLVGYSPIAMARKNIGWGMAMETFSSNFFGKGTHPGVIVSHPGPAMSKQAHENLKNSLTETYSGLGNSHRLMLLEEAMDVKTLGFSPEDSQFLESKQHHITDIARWFNIPPHKLKDMTKSSFNNIEAENSSYVIDTILPWAIHLEQIYDTQLLNKRQYEAGLYFKHVLEGLLRANSKERAEFYKIMIGSTIMTPNEAREKEDMNPSDDPLADELWAPTGNIPLSKFSEYLSKNQGGSNNVQEDDATDDPTDEEKENKMTLFAR